MKLLRTLAPAAIVLGGLVLVAWAQQAPGNLPGCLYTATPPTLADKQTTAVRCDQNGALNISGSISAETTAIATAAAPTYSEGVAEPLSQDLAGNLRITGTINASSSAKATAAAPSYVEGDDEPFSQNLTGDLRTIAKQSGTWNIGTVTAVTGITNPVDAAQSGAWVVSGTGTAGSAATGVVTVQGIAAMTPLLVDGSGSTQPISGTVTANAGTGWAASGIATESSLATVAGAISSARMQVNPIVGQAGVAAGTGVDSATTQRVSLATNVALPTGANTIGAVTQASGPWTSNVTQFGGTNVSTGTGTGGAGIPRVTVSSDSFPATQAVTQSGTWTVQPGNTPNTSAWLVQDVGGTANGLDTYVLEPTASSNQNNIKNGAGTVYHISVTNNSATVNYLRLYNAASGFSGCNSATNIKWEMAIPASTAGAGFVVDIAKGINFSTGISICVTGGYGQTNTTNATASAMSVNIGYK